MNVVSIVLAVYASALSTVLGIIAWRKDRRSIQFFTSYHRRSGWHGVHISVVNTGFRPVALQDIMFTTDDGGGYLNDLDKNLGIPCRLEEGEQLVLRIHVDDIEPDTASLVIRDTHRREHRLKFTPDMRSHIEGFREHIAETGP